MKETRTHRISSELLLQDEISKQPAEGMVHEGGPKEHQKWKS
jgi:hypothetical protein